MKFFLLIFFYLFSFDCCAQTKFSIKDSIKIELSEKKIMKRLTEFSENSADIILRRADENMFIATNAIKYICEQNNKGLTKSENKAYKEETNGNVYFTLTLKISDKKVVVIVDQVKHVSRGSSFNDIYKTDYPCNKCPVGQKADDCDWCKRVSDEIKDIVNLKTKNIISTLTERLK